VALHPPPNAATSSPRGTARGPKLRWASETGCSSTDGGDCTFFSCGIITGWLDGSTDLFSGDLTHECRCGCDDGPATGGTGGIGGTGIMGGIVGISDVLLGVS